MFIDCVGFPLFLNRNLILPVFSLGLDFFADPCLTDFNKIAEDFHVHNIVHGTDNIFKSVVDLVLVFKNRQKMKFLIIVF